MRRGLLEALALPIPALFALLALTAPWAPKYILLLLVTAG